MTTTRRLTLTSLSRNSTGPDAAPVTFWRLYLRKMPFIGRDLASLGQPPLRVHRLTLASYFQIKFGRGRFPVGHAANRFACQHPLAGLGIEGVEARHDHQNIPTD